jgi:hypothetical protein
MEMTPPQKRGRDDTRQGVDGHHLHRGQLLGRLHEADLGRHRASGAARKQQAGHDRAKLAHEGQSHEDAERIAPRHTC